MKMLLHPQTEQLELRTDASAMAVHHALDVVLDGDIAINDGDLRYRFAANSVFPEVSRGNATLIPTTSHVEITDESGAPLLVEAGQPQLVSSDPLSACVAAHASAHTGTDRTLNLRLIYDIYATGDMLMTCEIHNPHRAMHPDGIWDLGDAGSAFINSLSIRLAEIAPQQVHCRVETGGHWHTSANDFAIHQASSGGEHWDCPTHVNRFNQCTNEFRGYRYSMAGEDSLEGKRASPTIIVESENNACMSVTPLEFWQNFPKRLARKGDAVIIDLFP
ncbi:MAG: hypothetical protein AAF404_04980, partial [Pseudomonadota bacterium]